MLAMMMRVPLMPEASRSSEPTSAEGSITPFSIDLPPVVRPIRVLFSYSHTGDVPFIVVLLVLVVALLCRAVKEALRPIVRRWLAAVPVALTVFFCGAAATYGAFSAALACAVLAYLLAPTLTVLLWKSRAADLIAILLLWLPVEAGAGAALVPRHAQGVLHAILYGVAILLALA